VFLLDAYIQRLKKAGRSDVEIHMKVCTMGRMISEKIQDLREARQKQRHT
jgi:hypothetical protein